MKQAILILIFVALCLSTWAQCPNGDITFTTQQEINNFADLINCDTISGNLTIQPATPNAITNLNGLSQITTVEGWLNIEGTAATDLTGLSNLTSIGGYLRIIDNDGLTSLAGLDNLNSIEGDFRLSDNGSLNNFLGLESLSSIGGNLLISNSWFNSFNGLNNMTSIGVDFRVNTSNMSNFLGLENLTSIGGNFRVNHNFNLDNFSGLENLMSIGGNFDVHNTPLTSFTGLDNLTSINGNVDIYNNNALTTLSGLESLTSIGGYLDIYSNNALTALTGIGGPTSVGGILSIDSNDALTSLTGMENIDLDNITHLVLTDNIFLVTCNQANVCNYLQNGGTSDISGNASQCSTQSTIIDACSGVNPTCPTGNITFTIQQEIDDFANIANCTVIPGNVNIQAATANAITNLDGLNQITTIEGWLNIEGTEVTDLTGLNNLTSIGEYLKITNNDDLTSPEGLDNLTSIGGDFKVNFNSDFNDFSGLESLTSIGGSLLVSNSWSLNSFTGLDNMTSIGMDFKININPISNFSGLESLTSIGGNFRANFNSNLSSFSGLENLTSIGGYLDIRDNPSLTTLTDIENINPNSITDLTIIGNSNLTVCNQTNICTYLENGGTANIENNAPGCDTQAEVEIACVPLCSSLPPIIGVNLQTMPNGIYRAADEVNSTGTVPADGNVSFKAAQTILLDNNFTVESNADFSAEIKGCSGQ